MEIIKNIPVPTGNILIVSGTAGKLECLSLADYGKNVNVKANFLGLTRKINKVKHTKLLPLEDKWVITISTQYGCSSACKFCDVPKVGFGYNASYTDMIDQIRMALSLHPEVLYSNRINIHYARMGEPTWNPAVLRATYDIYKYRFGLMDSTFHPVVSTMLPRSNKNLDAFLNEWVYLKNAVYSGEAGLQLSINSTSDDERNYMFSGNTLSLSDISKLFDNMPNPVGRKYTLNFAVSEYEINASKLLTYFDPNKFVVKLTPMHKTVAALRNNIRTKGDYTTHHPYSKYEKELIKAGYDVIVFIASKEEDASRITCGNALLSLKQ